MVKAYAMEGVTAEAFCPAANEELFHNQVHLVRANAAMPAIVMLLPASAMLILLVVGEAARSSTGRMEKGDFFTFAFYIFNLTFPTFIMGWVVALAQRGAASMQPHRRAAVGRAPSIVDPPDAPEMSTRPCAKTIEFRESDLPLPRTIRRPRAGPAATSDLRRSRGHAHSASWGPVGSGKSTLASLIPHLYEVGTRGSFLIGGRDINQIPLRGVALAASLWFPRSPSSSP